ncbi:MAG: GntR family transcriptional regulator [Candidatus Obscuribacterales bacterium]|jgi:GntR family transcriptional regulator|nr:GntR family transcriptional regulator [Candidatus Obscuribacterales bacterium]
MLSTSIKLSISKDSSVPVKDQLIEQIGLQIASGTLKPKDKLPSIRALAQRLGIHHSTITAAYSHLEDAGLLEIRQGSGVRVAHRQLGGESQQKELSMDQLFKQLLARAAEQGMSRDELRSFTQKMLDVKPIKRIVVVDRNQDFHAILLDELTPHFDLPIEPITFENLSKKKELLKDSLIVTSFYHLYPLQSLDIDPTRFVVCTVEPGRDEIDALVALKPGSLMACISVSPTLLKMANNMAAALRGEEVAVRCLAKDDAQEIQYIMKHANLVLCDGPSEKIVKAAAGKIPVKVFHLYSPATLTAIRERLTKWN